MAGITALIQAIGDENISIQFLGACMTDISEKKNGISKVVFETDAINPAQIVSDTARCGIIIWCDKDKCLQALDDLGNGKLR